MELLGDDEITVGVTVTSTGTGGPCKFNTSDGASRTILDDDLAQAVCYKISSAHIGGFQSSKCVTLRRVVQTFGPISTGTTKALIFSTTSNGSVISKCKESAEVTILF